MLMSSIFQICVWCSERNASVVVWENQTVITVVSTNFVFVSDLYATADAVTLAVIKPAPPERKLCCGIREAEIQLSPRCQIVFKGLFCFASFGPTI